MSSDALVVPVVAACIVRGNSVLLSKRLTVREPSTLRKWEFPGGVVHFGEELRDALKREIYEELNLHIDPMNVLHVQVNTYESGIDYLVMFYECVPTTKWSIEPFRGNLVWANPQSIIDGRWDVLPGTVKAAERLLGRRGFSFIDNSATEQTADDTLRILTYEVGHMNELLYKGGLYGTKPKTARNFPKFLLKHQTADALSMLRMFCEHSKWDFEEIIKLGEERYLARQMDLEKYAITPRLRVRGVNNKQDRSGED